MFLTLLTFAVSAVFSASAFPPYFRIEVEFQRLENPGGLRYDGKSCDSFNKCDPQLSAVIDIDRPLTPFPAGPPKPENYPVIFTASDDDSPTIGKSISRDICGGSIYKITARAHVDDLDVGGYQDLINNFDCPFDVASHEVESDPTMSSWSASMQCRGYAQPTTIKLFARYRAYQITAKSCGVNEDELAAAHDNLLQPSHAHTPGVHDLVRLELELVSLEDSQGITYKGVACDVGTLCDPDVYVSLDTDKPLSAFPGPKPLTEFKSVFKAAEVNSPVINRKAHRDICGGALGIVNIRSHVYDDDPAGKYADVIESFNCIFSADYSKVALDESSADWSPTQNCVPLHSGHNIQLHFRYRIFDISGKDCGDAKLVSTSVSPGLASIEPVITNVQIPGGETVVVNPTNNNGASNGKSPCRPAKGTTAWDVLNLPGKVVGAGVGGAWGLLAPTAINQGAIEGAGGQAGGDTPGGPLGTVGKGVGKVIGSTWGALMPNSIREGSIVAAKGAGNVNDGSSGSTDLDPCVEEPVTQPPAASSSGSGWDLLNVPGKVIGAGVGGLWGLAVPKSVNQGAIEAAGGQVDNQESSQGPLGWVGKGAGKLIGGTWGALMPNSVREGSINAAKGAGNA